MREKREKKSFRERSSSLSLSFTEIGPWVFVGAKGKVGPHIESYA